MKIIIDMAKKEKKAKTDDSEQRQKAIEALLENGTVFEADRKGFLRHFSPKMRLRLAPPTLGVLYTMSGHFVSMEVDEDRVEAEPIPYSFILAEKNCSKLARALAAAVLAGRWRIRLFGRVVASYLMWQLTPRQLLRMTVLVLSMCGTADFINSIRLIKGTRLTEPKAERPVE